VSKSRICCFVLSVILLAVLFGCSTSASKEPEGFRNVKWGSEIGTLSGFEQIAEEGNLRFFEKKGEELKFEDVRLEKVVYGFFQGRFYTAIVYFPAAAFGRVQEIVTGQLGQPAQPEGEKGKCLWDGEKVSVLLAPAAGSGEGRLSYLYKPIQLEVELKK
jgi:hypothetical protein